MMIGQGWAPCGWKANFLQSNWQARFTNPKTLKLQEEAVDYK